MRVRKMAIEQGKRIGIDRFPNFHKTGSVRGMKRLYYGKNCLLVRCGNYVYNVTSEPRIFSGNCLTLKHTIMDYYNDYQESAISKHDKEFAQMFENFVNGRMRSAEDTGMVLATAHRYLQQMFKVFIGFMRQLAHN